MSSVIEPQVPMENYDLFSLIAVTDAADKIFRANLQFRDAQWDNTLSFKARYRSKFLDIS
jgi:hypothetical protein